jgi:hypothetical protein
MHPIGPSNACSRIFIFFFGLHHFAAMHPSFSMLWALIWFLRAGHLGSHGPLFSTQWPIIFGDGCATELDDEGVIFTMRSQDRAVRRIRMTMVLHNL